MQIPSFQAYALTNVPLIQAGDDLAQVIVNAFNCNDLTIQADDMIVIASKVVSKSEGRKVLLSDVEPHEDAIFLAEETGKDPRIVELILNESRVISRMRKGVLVTEHLLGFVSANAGLDASNVDNTQQSVLLLPENPDASARRIRARIKKYTDTNVAIVITDTHGRPFRLGNVGVALGVAGVRALWDRRGERDLFGREMLATVLGYADMVASAAHLLMGEGAEGLPIVLIRGLQFPQGDGKASDLNRPSELDLYR